MKKIILAVLILAVFSSCEKLTKPTPSVFVVKNTSIAPIDVFTVKLVNGAKVFDAYTVKNLKAGDSLQFSFVISENKEITGDGSYRVFAQQNGKDFVKDFGYFTNGMEISKTPYRLEFTGIELR